MMDSSPPLDRSSSRLKELLGRSVHDLRNPLAVVRASLEWIELELADREDILDAVRDATTATTRILGILEDLDTLSRLETADASGYGVIELSEVIARVAVATNARTEPRGVDVVSLATAPIHARGDDKLLARALEALVDVCVRAVPSAGSVEVDARVVEAESEARWVEISIGLRGTVATDGHTASIEALSSGGLGVYLALRVVEEHGGSLLVHPTTTVPRTTVRLPLG